MNIVVKRIKAFLIDYLFIAGYAFALFGVTLWIMHSSGSQFKVLGPVSGEILGFLTLTLPVILFFTFFERSFRAGTPGKIVFKLKVMAANGLKPSLGKLLGRNMIKFLPWEVAHFFVYRLYLDYRVNTPWWLLAGLIFPMVLAVVYLLLIIFSKSHRTIYEWVSGTMVII